MIYLSWNYSDSIKRLVRFSRREEDTNEISKYAKQDDKRRKRDKRYSGSPLKDHSHSKENGNGITELISHVVVGHYENEYEGDYKYFMRDVSYVDYDEVHLQPKFIQRSEGRWKQSGERDGFKVKMSPTKAVKTCANSHPMANRSLPKPKTKYKDFVPEVEEEDEGDIYEEINDVNGDGIDFLDAVIADKQQHTLGGATFFADEVLPL